MRGKKAKQLRRDVYGSRKVYRSERDNQTYGFINKVEKFIQNWGLSRSGRYEIHRVCSGARRLYQDKKHGRV